jgi:hypothetical protein
MIGKEREARDGHYVYTAQEPFASAKSGTCTNQTQVVHWLENFLTHHAPESQLHIGDRICTVRLVHATVRRFAGSHRDVGMPQMKPVVVEDIRQ